MQQDAGRGRAVSAMPSREHRNEGAATREGKLEGFMRQTLESMKVLS